MWKSTNTHTRFRTLTCACIHAHTQIYIFLMVAVVSSRSQIEFQVRLPLSLFPFSSLKSVADGVFEEPAYFWKVVSKSRMDMWVVDSARRVGISRHRVAVSLHIYGWTRKSRWFPRCCCANKSFLQKCLPSSQGRCWSLSGISSINL